MINPVKPLYHRGTAGVHYRVRDAGDRSERTVRRCRIWRTWGLHSTARGTRLTTTTFLCMVSSMDTQPSGGRRRSWRVGRRLADTEPAPACLDELRRRVV